MTTFFRSSHYVVSKLGRTFLRSGHTVTRDEWEGMHYNEHLLTPDLYFKSLTIPLHCKHCGEKIFLYSNNHGSKVLFECLGKPWTKHDCQERQKNDAFLRKAHTYIGENRIFEVLYPASSLKSVGTQQQIIFVNKDKKYTPILLEKSEISSFSDCIILGKKDDNIERWHFSIYDSATNNSYEITGIQQAIPKAKRSAQSLSPKPLKETILELKEDIINLKKAILTHHNENDINSLTEKLHRLNKLEKTFSSFQEVQKARIPKRGKKKKRKNISKEK